MPFLKGENKVSNIEREILIKKIVYFFEIQEIGDKTLLCFKFERIFQKAFLFFITF